MLLTRALLCLSIVLGIAAVVRAEDGAAARSVAAVQPAAQPAGGKRLAPPILLSVEVVADPAPARAVAPCDDRDQSRCDPAGEQAPVAGTRR